MKTVTELLQPVEKDLEDLVLELKNLIGAGHPILQAAAEHLFSAGGKRLRPGIVLLISKAISVDSSLSTKHKISKAKEYLVICFGVARRISFGRS